MPRPVQQAMQAPMPLPRADAAPFVPNQKRALRPRLPVRLAQTGGAVRPSPPPRSADFLDRVVAIVSQPGFTLRRSRSTSLSASPQASTPSTPSTPGLEDRVAFALFAQDAADAHTARNAYQSARRLSCTATEEYIALVNDMWVSPATGLKASCLTHALMSGHDAVAEWLEAHGAEESYSYPATPQELALVREKP